ncbi:uncharacterized protein MKK02DRAFT_41522 [Dioszegia hungarica]|uniref:Uncharacterized protein n=1 Tax=Dioszegia hungarica TaxID=4972 RepID=A0AA38LQH6_9TREE|nr:uncharacterized protein MKK02DRAFT_41522 [Dioszegia hungarica]KAI9631890.1 hypothetical protein MKK02DRAFT_41522 [Dioszegia hungarica]
MDMEDLAYGFAQRAEGEVSLFKKNLEEMMTRGGVRTTLPSLVGLCVSSVYSEDKNFWSEFAERDQLGTLTVKRRARPIRDMFDLYLAPSVMGSICSRSNCGPLGFAQLSYLSTSRDWIAEFHKGEDVRADCIRTAHFSPSVRALPIRFGSPARWVFDGPSTSDWGKILLGMIHQVNEIIEWRTKEKKDVAHLRIYCSTNRFTPKAFFDEVNTPNIRGREWAAIFSGYSRMDRTTHILSPADQRRLTQKLGAHLQAHLRAKSGLKDEVEWYPSFESPLFHSFCVPLLYTTITTDEFPKLLNYAHLASMRRRLALVKTLRIEYQDKVSEPTYLQTFIYGIYGKPYWTLFGRVESKVEKELYGTERCSAELRIIIESLTEMMHLGGIPKVMPNLERVAVSSVYGHETDAWTEFENLQDDTAVDTVAEAHEAR